MASRSYAAASGTHWVWSSMTPPDSATHHSPDRVLGRGSHQRQRGMSPETDKVYTLVGSDGRAYWSTTPGVLGGHRRSKLYGRLDCPSALRAMAAGRYVAYRVFFASEATARAAGYRPCA